MAESGFEGIQPILDNMKQQQIARQVAEQLARRRAAENEIQHANKNQQLGQAWVTAAKLANAKGVPYDAQLKQLRTIHPPTQVRVKGFFRDKIMSSPYQWVLYPGWRIHTSYVEKFSGYDREYGSAGAGTPSYDRIAQDYFLLIDGSVGRFDRKYVNARAPGFDIPGGEILGVDQLDLAAVTGLEGALAQFIVDKNLA